MASLTPGIPLTAQVDLSLDECCAKTRAQGRVNDGVLSAFACFLFWSQSYWFAHCSHCATEPGAFLYSICPSLWNTARAGCARLASHLLLLCFLTDSPASASREIAFFFPEFNEQLWYQQEEPRLRCGQVYYNAEERVHCVFRDEETELT